MSNSCPPEASGPPLPCATTRSAGSLKRARSAMSDSAELESVSTTFLTSDPTSAPAAPNPPADPEPKSSTQESQAKSKSRTSSGSKKLSSDNFRGMNSLQISRPGSTLSVAALSPFWTERCEAASRRLLLPTATGFAASHLISSSTCCGKAASASWFSTQARATTERLTRPSCRKTCLPSQPSLSLAIMESARRAIAASEERKLIAKQKRRDKAEEKRLAKGEPPPIKKKRAAKYKFTRSRMIRIYPTAEQRVLLKNAFDACRHVYNKTIEAINSRACKSNRKAMRVNSVNKDVWDRTSKDKAWETIDFELRDGAMLDAFKAIKSTNESMAAKGNEDKKWEFKSRKKKDLTESIAIRARRLNANSNPWYEKMFGHLGARQRNGVPIMDSGQLLPDVFETDVRIWHHKILGKYMIIIPEEAPGAVPDIQGPAKGACVSIDPGVRTFATCYDPDGLICKWGCTGPKGELSANNKLWRIANEAHSIRARMQNPKLRTRKAGHGRRHRKRRHMRKAAAKLERRIKCMVGELHHKLALWLCKNYETVLLPSFRVSQMVKKRDGRGGHRKIGRKTTKQLYSLAHCQFRVYLHYLAKRYGTLVVESDEAFTTQTCGSCGRLSRVGAAETFRCKHTGCGATFDRDENAARNIMLKFIQDQGVDVTIPDNDVLMPCPCTR